MRTPLATTLPLLQSIALAGAAASGSATASAAFGPPQSSCKGLNGKAKMTCQRSNQTARMVFDVVKDSRIVGRHPDGATVDATFCANGKWKIDVVGPGGPLSFGGRRWVLTDTSRRSPKSSWISALATGPSDNIFTRIGLQRRGTAWVFTTSRWTTAAPTAEKTSAMEACAAL